MQTTRCAQTHVTRSVNHKINRLNPVAVSMRNPRNVYTRHETRASIAATDPSSPALGVLEFTMSGRAALMVRYNLHSETRSRSVRISRSIVTATLAAPWELLIWSNSGPGAETRIVEKPASSRCRKHPRYKPQEMETVTTNNIFGFGFTALKTQVEKAMNRRLSKLGVLSRLRQWHVHAGC
jgi:hypothetical protein